MAEQRISFQRYLDHVDNAVAREDVEALINFWYQSTFLYSREESRLVHEKIVSKIPELALAHRVPYKGNAFREFIESYDLVMLDRACDSNDNPNRCLRYFAKRNNKKGISRAIENGANHWLMGVYGAVSGSHLELVEFFWPKLEEEDINKGKIGTILSRIEVKAGKRGDLDIIKFLLEKLPRSAEYIIGGAVDGGHLDVAKFFFEEFLPRNPRKRRELGSVVLYRAALEGQKEILNYAIKNGANEWGSGLSGAASAGNLGLVKFFMKKQIKPTDLEDAIANASRRGRKEIVKYLIKSGVSSQRAIERGLLGATSGGHLDLAVFFLKHGASNVEDALISAVNGGHLELVKLFLNRGANNAEDILIKLWKFDENVVDLLLKQLPHNERQIVIGKILRNKDNYMPVYIQYLKDTLADMNVV